MRSAVVVDTGPLVALYNPNDEHHDRCREAAKLLRTGAITTWPVLTEAAYLLKRHDPGIRLLANDVARGTFVVEPMDTDALIWMATFMEKYGNIGADLADASVMWAAERRGTSSIFTLDRRDFGVYRFSSGDAPVLLPE